MAIDWTAMSDEELEAESLACSQERTRRANLMTIPQSIDAMNRTYLEAQGMAQGEAWVRPEGAHNAYPLAWIVVHNGKTWESTVYSNVWEPGVSGWKEQVAPGEYPQWVQPAGAHDAYPLGAEVAHNSLHWRSDVADNVWEPGVYGWTEF